MQLPDASHLVAELRNKLAAWPNIQAFHFIGIERGGMLLARTLHKELHIQGELGSLNISFHRDDFFSKDIMHKHPQKPALGPSRIPFSLDNADLMLIDDVFMTGRSTRAALNEIFDFGRPNSVRFACLIDLAIHELPIRPDIVAARMTLEMHQRIQLTQDANGDFQVTLHTPAAHRTLREM